MNNVHDMGGMQGYGPVVFDDQSEVFHADWERRAFALTVAMNTAKQWNIDRSRSMRESLPPLRYLSNTYYQIWLDGLERLLLDSQMATAEEIKQGVAITPAKSGVRALGPSEMPQALLNGWPSERAPTAMAQFQMGDVVRTVEFQPRSHTRLPRYARDKVGVIVAVNGVHVFPDKNAIGSDDPQWMYTVEFKASEIWGPDSTASVICLNCWEPYLRRDVEQQHEAD